MVRGRAALQVRAAKQAKRPRRCPVFRGVHLTNKPTLVVDLHRGAPTTLIALHHLSAIKKGASFHELIDQRHPLGIYNLSIGRICDKLKKCSERLERYWLSSSLLVDLDPQVGLRHEIIDYVELCIYSAAEHVDDIESIAKSFFPDPQSYAKSSYVKALKRAIKPIRDQISTLANMLKHAHGRLRLYALEINHDSRDFCLQGFFIEGYAQGTVAPNPILHGEGEVIVSLTSLLWSIVIYLGQISEQVGQFLLSISAVDRKKISEAEFKPFRDVVIALARLPIYSLDEIHPFERVRLIIRADEMANTELKSNIYGSLLDRWARTSKMKFRNFHLMYEGDGVSRSFRIIHPRKVGLQYWGNSEASYSVNL